MLSNRQLEIFIAVFEEGSMTAAARKIHMTQPAISQTIKEIEGEYNTEMFERYGARLHITQAGKILYKYAKRILNLHRDLNEAIMLHEGVHEIRLGANISAGTAQIMPLIQAFNRIHPGIEVKVMVFQAPVLLKALQENELDLALIEDQKKNANFGDLIMEPYYQDRITVVASNTHPYAGKTCRLKDLSEDTFLFREKGAGVRDMFDHILNLKNMSVNIGWQCTSTEAIVDAVEHQVGIAVLPYLLVKKYLDAGEIQEITLEDVSLSRMLNIVYHKDKVITQPLQDMIDLIKRCP
ncbi:MAG: LysR family transcriptional regulator [Lachnospiraceae bacterium]|nr:LysR family transcriptional regulator [Lachnospiraceae bacterium]